MKKILLGLIAVSALGLVGCDNTIARSFGGTMHLELEPDRKLEMITWKESELWYLTRPMKADEEAETLIFQEKSELGMLEGKVIITETKSK